MRPDLGLAVLAAILARAAYDAGDLVAGVCALPDCARPWVSARTQGWRRRRYCEDRCARLSAQRAARAARRQVDQ